MHIVGIQRLENSWGPKGSIVKKLQRHYYIAHFLPLGNRCRNIQHMFQSSLVIYCEASVVNRDEEFSLSTFICQAFNELDGRKPLFMKCPCFILLCLQKRCWHWAIYFAKGFPSLGFCCWPLALWEISLDPHWDAWGAWVSDHPQLWSRPRACLLP